MKTSQNKLQLLVETVQELSLARDLETIMKIVRKKARLLTGADGASFILRDNNMCYYADENAISPLWKGQRFPLEACVSGWAMINKKSVFIEDIYKDDRVPVDAYKPTFVKSLAMVPIRTMDPIGAIGNYWASNHLATEDEIFMLQSLADIISVSMENISVYQELEQRVQQRTKQLEDANKTLQTFNSAVSHDLKAPLRAFIGYTNLLIEDYSSEIPPEANAYLLKLRHSADGMNKLLSGLMDFSKIAATDITLKSISMTQMADDTFNELKALEKDRTIHCEVRVLPLAKGDPVLIKQVFYNLIGNSIKYTGKKSEAKIEIGAKFSDNEIVYFVKDNGDGFDMQYSDKLFNIFQRLHAQDQFHGNGVGLALVERIISKHGGKVWAEGRPGDGAIFYFSMPLPKQVVN